MAASDERTADAVTVGRRVRRRRRLLGLSQDELAARAGVSRQAVSALEGGRHLPRVDAAVGLARALGVSVEDLVAATPDRALHVLGAEVGDGTAVRAARVGAHTVVVPLHEVAGGDLFGAPDATVVDGRVDPLAEADLDGFVVVGCDPALGLLADLGPVAGRGRLLPVLASSGAARLALTTGRAHAAVVHDVVPTPDPREPDRVRRLPFATWRTGVAAPDRATLDAVLDGEAPVVGRDAGAAAQVAFERGVPGPHPASGAPARSHLDAARRALAGGVAAVTIEPAALALGLVFHPLETHAVELWIDVDAADHPGARALGDLVGGSLLRRRLAVLPAYELTGAA